MGATVELSLIPSFIEVVRHGSFTKAADALHVPKSTVSRHVSRLEEHLGVQLLVRTTRKLRLTEEGQRYYDRVATAVEQLEEAGRAAQQEREEPHGELRISIPSDFEHLPDLMTSFLRRYPKVSLDIQVSGAIADLVGEGFDLAIRAGVLDDSTLVARKLVTVAFHLMASREYLEAHGTPTTIEELAEHDCVLHRGHQGVARWNLVGPEGPVAFDARGKASSDDLAFVASLVMSGAGVGYLPERIFDRQPDRVLRVMPDYAGSGGSVYLVYPGARHVPAKVRAFRDHLLEHGLFQELAGK